MGVRASLMSSMITNAVNLIATFIAIYIVDRFRPSQHLILVLLTSLLDLGGGRGGRKILFIMCGTIMSTTPMRLALRQLAAA